MFAVKRSALFTYWMPGKTEEYVVEGLSVRRLGRPEESHSYPYSLNNGTPARCEDLRARPERVSRRARGEPILSRESPKTTA